MSRLRDRRQRHDRYYRQAKQDKLPARSVYKLEELDRRFRLIRAGGRVLDLGCCPGSWMLYAARRVGPGGRVVGLDRGPVRVDLPPNAVALEGDVLQAEAAWLRAALPAETGRCFHLVLSDMAPDTTGVAFTDQARSAALFGRALALALEVGCPGSAFVGKLFMGESFRALLEQVRARYAATRTVRPDATRSASTEVYLVAQGLKV